MFGQGRLSSRWAFSGRFVAAVGGFTLVALAITLSLWGCGGGGGGPSPAPKLSGNVTAPQGTPVAQAPSLLQRLASLLISVAEAQALQGQAVADATVKAFVWPNTSDPVAQTKTDSNGRYTLQLPSDSIGKDIVVIAEKSVTGGTLRLSTIVADVPKEGRAGVNLDAATTLAAEQIAKVAKDNNISDLSPNAIAIILSEVREIVKSLQRLNLVVGASDSPLPTNFGEGLQKPSEIAQVVQQVEETVTQQQQYLPADNVGVAKSIVQMLRDLGMSAVNLPETEATTIQSALSGQQQVINTELQIATEFLERIKFPRRVLGFDDLENNPALSSLPASGPTPTANVTGGVWNDLTGERIPNAQVDAYVGSRKLATAITDTNGEFSMQLSISQPTKVTFVATSGNLIGAMSWRIDQGENWVGVNIPQSNMLGLPPARYREVWIDKPWLPRYLERIGNAPDDKTWIVEVAQAGSVSGTIRSRQGTEMGMVLTVTVQNPIGIFRYTHEAGKYTFQVRKPNDANLQYDGSIAVTTDSQGNPTQVVLSATVKDSALKTPITFSGTLQGTPTQTGKVTGVIRSPATVRGSRVPRSRQSSGSSIAPYKEAKFVNVALQSQYGSASIGELKVVWLNDSLEPDKLQQISLTNLRANSQTSKPVSLVINSASVELQPTTQQEKEQYHEELKPKTATFSATIEGSGIRLEVSNMQASDFVFVKVGEKWNWWTWTAEPVYRPVPRSLSGQVSYSSPTLSFKGSVNAGWENLQGPEPAGFGDKDDPVALAQVPKGTFSLQGNWAPQIGRPAGIDLQMTSNPQGNAPHVTIKLTLNYGGQGLSGTITGTLDIQNNQSYGFKSGNLDMSHSPSNFKVRVSAEKGKATSGQIVTAQGEKVADIGEARNLGLPDLGSALIVKYTDGTFETLESVLPSNLPRSRLSKK